MESKDLGVPQGARVTYLRAEDAPQNLSGIYALTPQRTRFIGVNSQTISKRLMKERQKSFTLYPTKSSKIIC
jgi:hypothetical protein